MTGRARIAALAGAGIVVAGLVPLLVRQVPFFRVRRVEVVGVRYLDPHRIVTELGLAPDQNLFDPLGAAREALEAVPGVTRVALERRLPGTLRVTVAERVPAAFVPGDSGLTALDCAGRPLPYDPTTSGLDLPLVPRADTGLVGTLCLVRAADSALYQQVEFARATGGEEGTGAVTLELGSLRVLLRRVPTTDEIAAVGAVQRHLAAASRPAVELDARFGGWVVARWDGT